MTARFWARFSRWDLRMEMRRQPCFVLPISKLLVRKCEL